MTNETVPTISNTYYGQDAMTDFAKQSEYLAQNGYVIASQVQTPGARTRAAEFFMGIGVTALVLGLFSLAIGFALAVSLWIIAAVCLVIGLVSGRTTELAVVWKRAPAALPQALAAPSPMASSPVEAIDALANLRDRGAITAEEYEAKKAELLQRV